LKRSFRSWSGRLYFWCVAVLVVGAALPALIRAQALEATATLETRQPEVQWAAAGASDGQAVPARQTVRAGDRIRTGPGAAARLVYFEGTAIDVGAETGLRVERLERSAGGNIVSRIVQTAGTTVSRVVRLVDPAASFEVETPAATAFVRGTTPRVQVTRGGGTRVGNLPDPRDPSPGNVNVQGKDPNATTVTLAPGQETFVLAPGLAPTRPAPISESAQLVAAAELPVLQYTVAAQDRDQLRQELAARAAQNVAIAEATTGFIERQFEQAERVFGAAVATLGAVPVGTPTPVPRRRRD
jgi:hypothetical protein